MMLLKLRQRALRLSAEERSLDVLLSPEDPDVFQQNLTMALYITKYPEYQEWRLQRLRALFPASPPLLRIDTFLDEYKRYKDAVRDMQRQYEILENHFSFVSPSYETFLEVAMPFFFEEYVDKHMVSFLFSAKDAMLEFRRHGSSKALENVSNLLFLFFHWSDHLAGLEWVWENVYLMAYEYQSRVDFDSVVAVEYHLTREYLMSVLLPGSDTFYSRIVQIVIPQCRFALSFGVLFSCTRVFAGMVAYRPFPLVREWENYIQGVWEKDPWDAVRSTRCFLEKVDPTEEVSTSVHKAYQTQVSAHARGLARTLSKQPEGTIQWVAQNTTDLEELLGRGYMRHVWEHRETSLPDARRVLETVGNAFLPLRAFLFDLDESLEHFQYNNMGVLACRDTLQYSPHWPLVAIQPALLPPALVEWKETFGEVYREKYPHRKWLWLDFHSTVALTNGATMTLPHVLILQEMERRGGTVPVDDLVSHFGWDAVMVHALVGSLVQHKRYALLVQQGQTVLLSANTIPPGIHVSLPVLSHPTTRHQERTHRSDQDHGVVLQAKIVRALKKEGPLPLTRLKEISGHSEMLDRVLQRLLSNEYVRCDEELYHYVP